MDLRAGGDEDAVGGAIAVGHGVAALGGRLHAGGAQVVHALTREREKRGAGAVLHGHLVHRGGLVTVAGAHGQDVGHGAEGGEVLDGLVGGAVLAEADGVVGHDKDGAGLRERGHADGGAHVIREDEEGGAVRDEARAVEAHAVGDGAHAMLAHAKADVALGVGTLLEVTVHLHQSHVGGREVGGAADEAGHCGRDGVQHRLAVQPGSEALVLGSKGGQARLPAGGEGARDELLELSRLLGVLGGVRLHRGVPLRLDRLARLNLCVAHGGVHLVRHLEGAVLPLEVLTRRGRLIGTQGRAVHVVAVRLVGGAVTNEGGDLDEGRLVGDGLGSGHRGAQAVNV
mmetsp:Transcript_22929/g.40811  ORF Transcript_22929/g.40811 Transcript_22929/m.40811 type:complete len:342 (+) Transcript_22929:619-1644(+)